MSWEVMLVIFVGGWLTDRAFFCRRNKLHLFDICFLQAILHSCNALSLLCTVYCVENLMTYGLWAWMTAGWIGLMFAFGAASVLLEKQEKGLREVDVYRIGAQAKGGH